MLTPGVSARLEALRDLVKDLRFGQADYDDLDNALLELERELKLPLTAAE